MGAAALMDCQPIRTGGRGFKSLTAHHGDQRIHLRVGALQSLTGQFDSQADSQFDSQQT
jgi:hypothetical protein